MFKTNLVKILGDFHRVASKLEKHVEKKAQEQLELLADKSFIEDAIDATVQEIDRADRVLTKIGEFLA